MIVNIFSQKIEGHILWGILLEEGEKRMEYHPGDLEKTIKAYEDFKGRKITEDELMGLQIA